MYCLCDTPLQKQIMLASNHQPIGLNSSYLLKQVISNYTGNHYNVFTYTLPPEEHCFFIASGMIKVPALSKQLPLSVIVEGRKGKIHSNNLLYFTCNYGYMVSALRTLSSTSPQRQVCLLAIWQCPLSPTKETSERLFLQETPNKLASPTYNHQVL